jgi:hypothetical protein
MSVSEVSKLGDELLWPWFEALDLVKPGDDGAPLVFANALSGVTPALFDEALQRAENHIFLAYREWPEISEREARLVSKRFEEAARREYERLQMVSGPTNTGTT